jgi:hypothetical protein
MSTFFLNEDYDLIARSPRGINILQAASVYSTPGILKRVLWRLAPNDRYTLMNSCGETFNSSLYPAASHNKAVNIAVLLVSRAIIEFEGGPAGTALMGACETGSLGTMKLLVRQDALVCYTNAKRGSNHVQPWGPKIGTL